MLISRVLADPDFPDRLNPSKVDKDGKPKKFVHSPRIPLEEYYEGDNKVYANFTNSDGRAMRYIFRYGQYNVDKVLTNMGKPPAGNFECLIVATEFLN